MNRVIQIGLSLLPSLISTAILLPPSQPLSSTLIAPPPPPLPVLVNDTTSPALNVLRISCDIRYGDNINPSSCRDVFHYIAKTDQPATFSERHTGSPNDLPLPVRWTSNDGRCFVQPALIRGMTTGLATSTEIGRAAYTIFQRCVVEKGLGGIADMIGGDNHLNVVVAQYEPRVSCDKTATPGPPWGSCLAILSDMAATRVRKVFGDKSRDPRVEVNVPYYFKAIDARCQLAVEIQGKSTSASWYEIWEAVVALAAMCVRAHDKGGRAYGIGLRKTIVIEISDEHPDFSGPAASSANVSGLVPLLGLEAPGTSSFE